MFVPLTSFRATVGVNVSASTSEVRSAETMVRASARKKTPATPSRKASGRKTTTGVSVEPTIGVAISATASSMAARRSIPAAMWVYRFSTTTMASSMMSPIAAAMPPSVMRLKLISSSRMTTSVTRTEIGITSIATTVVPQLCRKRTRMAIERLRPTKMLSHTLAMDCLTRRD